MYSMALPVFLQSQTLFAPAIAQAEQEQQKQNLLFYGSIAIGVVVVIIALTR